MIQKLIAELVAKAYKEGFETGKCTADDDGAWTPDPYWRDSDARAELIRMFAEDVSKIFPPR